jgi:hypothetical protein
MQDYASQYEIDFSPQQIKKLTPYLDNIVVPSKNKKTITYLTLKHRAFAWYYVFNSNNKADAYRRAFCSTYNSKKQILEINQKEQSNQRCAIEGNNKYRKEYIQQAIQKIREKLEEEISMDVPQGIIEQLQIMCTFDPAMFYNADGTIKFKNWKEIPEKYRCCVESMEVKYYGKGEDEKQVIVLKLCSRDKAREALLKIIPGLLLPEKKNIQYTTLDKDGNEVGFDPSNYTDEELKKRLLEYEEE